jgi:hypothetical protein
MNNEYVGRNFKLCIITVVNDDLGYVRFIEMHNVSLGLISPLKFGKRGLVYYTYIVVCI